MLSGRRSAGWGGWGRRALLGTAVVALASAGWGARGAARAQRDEVRAVWVVRTDLTSPESVRQVVANVRRAGLNTIVAQVRGRGDAYYRDGREPRALALRAQPAEF